MIFSERLQKERIRAQLTQKELAAKSGLSERTIQSYELGKRTPNQITSVQRIAEVLGVRTEYLLGEDGMLVVSAAERGGPNAKRDVSELVEELTAMFAGGELSEQDRDAAMRALNAAYWDTKKINQKYTKKVYRRAKKAE